MVWRGRHKGLSSLRSGSLLIFFTFISFQPPTFNPARLSKYQMKGIFISLSGFPLAALIFKNILQPAFFDKKANFVKIQRQLLKPDKSNLFPRPIVAYQFS
jgi:hypothetical protein